MIDLQHQADGGIRLNIVGPMRLAELAELLEHTRTLAASGGAIELDLSKAAHLHSGSLQILRALERHAVEAGTKFSVIAASDAARDALQLCGLSHWIGKEG